jgi:hypothetical protein
MNTGCVVFTYEHRFTSHWTRTLKNQGNEYTHTFKRTHTHTHRHVLTSRMKSCTCSGATKIRGTLTHSTVCVGLARILYIWCVYIWCVYIWCVYGIFGIFGREITKYTVVYGVNVWFWPTLRMCCITLTISYTRTFWLN